MRRNDRLRYFGGDFEALDGVSVCRLLWHLAFEEQVWQALETLIDKEHRHTGRATLPDGLCAVLTTAPSSHSSMAA